jgi:hypothetical protein
MIGLQQENCSCYPRWGYACHQPGESKSTQGLEENWNYLKKAKNYHQKRNATGDLESILEAISQREDQRTEGYTFSTQPTISKKNWSILAKYHATAAAVDHKSSAFYSLDSSRALTRKEAIGNPSKMGGYVAYIPNDAFTSECTADALKQSPSAAVTP